MIIKRYIIILLILTSCESEQTNINPYIPNISFDRIINLNLPSYDNLNFTGGSVIIDGLGVCGVILFNFNDDILAWEACDPNHKKRDDCPSLDIDGVQAKCNCVGNIYSLATGQLMNSSMTSNYPLIRYKTELIGSNLRVYN